MPRLRSDRTHAYPDEIIGARLGLFGPRAFLLSAAVWPSSSSGETAAMQLKPAGFSSARVTPQ